MQLFLQDLKAMPKISLSERRIIAAKEYSAAHPAFSKLFLHRVKRACKTRSLRKKIAEIAIRTPKPKNESWMREKNKEPKEAKNKRVASQG